LTNNRAINRNYEPGPLHSIVNASIAPLLDIFKPTRKENVIGNLRKNGNINNNTSGSYINNPYDLTKITNRQMTENKVDLNHLNVDAGGRDGYLVSKQIEKYGQRPSTNYNGITNVGGGANKVGDQSRESTMNQINNCNKQQNSVVLPGNISLFNTSQHLSTIRDDVSRENNRLWIPSNGPSIIPNKSIIGERENMQTLSEETNRARLDSNILDAFKKNPYTQSLHSIA
jgi:hypothetical protein